jgi:glutaredoxin
MAIELYGMKNCSACLVVKRILTQRNIDFEYKILEELSESEKDRVIAIARNANSLKFPVILKDGVFVTVDEVQ